MKSRRIWKVRTVKSYPEAHNHMCIGEILEETAQWLRIKGRTFHFGRAVNRLDDIRMGAVMVRVIPWNRVEIINELPVTFDYENGRIDRDKEGNIVYRDAARAIAVFVPNEKSY